MPTATATDEDHQRRLEEASAVCARGRQYWTRDNNAQLALQEFEHALQLLETLLGTYHSLTAKTYYWLGFIRKHDPNTYEEALQAFVQTARIRLVLLGPSQEATQEAISAIRWVLSHQQHKSNEDIKIFLNQLYESIRLETLGDARLRHREYSAAIEFYQQAMEIFPDPKHATIMGKRAFCHFKGGGELDVAMDWYRKALLVFTTQTVHGRSHPDVPSTLERMEQVLQAHGVYTAETIQSYLQQVLSSVQEQYAGQVALSQGKFQVALDHYKATLEMEQALLGSHHGIIQQTLQPLVTMAETLCATSLEQTILSLETSNQQLQEQLAAERTTHTEEGDAATPKTTHASKETMGDKNDKTTDWETKCKDAETQVSKLQEQLKEFEAKQQQRHEEEIQSRLKDLTSQLAKATEQLQKESDLRIQSEKSLRAVESQWKETQTRKDEEYNQLQNELKEKVQQLEQLQQDVVKHQAKIQEYERQSTKSLSPTETTNMKALAEQLQEARDANAEFHKRLLSAEAAAVSLNDVRRKSEEKLKDALAQQADLKKELQQRDDKIAQLQSQLERLEDSNHPHHSKTIYTSNTKTPVGSPARSGSHSMNADAESEASSVGEPSETQRQVEDQLRELQTDTRLKAQNERAIKTIQALSKELIALEEKYRKLASKHEKLRQLFTKLEQVNRTLKEQNIQILKASARRSELSDSLHRRILSSDSNMTVGKGSSIDSTGSFEGPGPDETPTPEILKSIRLSQSRYRSALAEFIVRRPHVSKPSLQEVRLFGDSTICSLNYEGNIQEPHSIEIVAMIRYDHSRMYLIGTQIIHRRMDGTCTNFDHSNTEPLGWISYEHKGQTLHYSLDEIFEEAQIYREHYCQSVALNATKQSNASHPLPLEMKVLQWFAQRSPVMERVFYSYGSHAWTYSLDRPTVALSSFLMALLAILVARFWIR